MTNFVVFCREVRSRWMLLAASVAMGLLVSALPLVFSPRSSTPEEFRSGASLGVALIWTVLLALGLGATCLVRDLVDHRLAFDLRLPVSELTIWSGRLLGAYATILISGCLVLAPSLLAGWDRSGIPGAIDLLALRSSNLAGAPGFRTGWVPYAPPSALALLMLVSNFGGLATLGRRVWSVVDLATTIVFGTAVVFAAARLQSWGAAGPVRVLVIVAVSVTGFALVTASWLQIGKGRGALEIAHRWASSTLAFCAALVALGSVTFVEWYLRPSLASLSPEQVSVRTVGDRLVAVEGTPRGRSIRFRFLVDPAGGRWRRLGPSIELRDDFGLAASPDLTSSALRRLDSPLLLRRLSPGTRWPTVSTDGSTLVWFETEGLPSFRDALRMFLEVEPRLPRITRGDTRIWVARSDDGFATRSPLGAPRLQSPAGWNLSADGERIALRWPADALGLATLQIEDTRAGIVEFAHRLTDCREAGFVRFLSEDTIQASCGEIWCSSDGPQRADLREIDLGTGEVVRVSGYIDSQYDRIFRELSRGNRSLRLVLRNRPGEQAHWVIGEADAARTPESPFGTHPWLSPSDARFVSDDEVLLTFDASPEGAIALYRGDGTRRWWVAREENRFRIRQVVVTNDQAAAIIEAHKSRFDIRDGVHRSLPDLSRTLRVNLTTGAVAEGIGPREPESKASPDSSVRLVQDVTGRWIWIDLRHGMSLQLPIGPDFGAAAERRRSTGQTSTFLAPIED